MKLRGALAEQGLAIKDVAKELCISPQCVSQRLFFMTEWRLSEIYIVMDLIGQPYENIPIYFPNPHEKEQ